MNSSTPDRATSLQVRRVFAAPRERVFRAWIERDALEKWMSARGNKVVVSQLEVQVGGNYCLESIGADGTRTVITGKYLEISVPEKLVFTWKSTITDSQETLVTIMFIARGASTEIILTHDRLVDGTMLTSHREGWTGMLERLASAIEDIDEMSSAE